MAENQRRRLEILQKHLSQPTHQTDACGIIAVVGGNSPAVDFLLGMHFFPLWPLRESSVKTKGDMLSLKRPLMDFDYSHCDY